MPVVSSRDGSILTRRRYADWKAPAHDASKLIWPEPRTLLDETLSNQRLLSSAEHVLIQNTPLPELRRLARKLIDHDDARPLIATGHQTELHHPGVWAKNALLSAAAPRIDADALHLSVDTDEPKHLALRWPGASWPISDDPRLTSAAWSGQLAPPSREHLELVGERLGEATARWDFAPMAPTLLDSLGGPFPAGTTLPQALSAALHDLDARLGLRYRSRVVSPIWLSAPFLAFVHDVIARLDSFAPHYNEALAEYRRDTGTRTPTRPMPDLFITPDGIEAPFWLDDLGSGRRSRPSVFRVEGGFALQLLDGRQFVFDAGVEALEAASRLGAFLSQTRHRLSPRALTLTMFFRLLVVDQFVHGIGGGRYDQVTDRIIAGHFGIDPPAFSVATATLYFPDAVGRERVCLPCIEQEGHRLKHALLGEGKRRFLDRIDALPRRSIERGQVFAAMHDALQSAARENESLKAWQERARLAKDAYQLEEILFDRELFYGIQPRERLDRMVESFVEAFAGT